MRIHGAWYSGRKFRSRSVRLAFTTSATWARKASLPGSIHWRSSTNVTEGGPVPRASKSWRTKAKSRCWRTSGSMRETGCAGSATPTKSKTRGKSSRSPSSSSTSVPAILRRASAAVSRSAIPKWARKSSSSGRKETALPCAGQWAS